MKIFKYTWQHRNDFEAIYECEHCAAQQKIKRGYNDENYHMNVIPTFHCEKCGKNRAGDVKA